MADYDTLTLQHGVYPQMRLRVFGTGSRQVRGGFGKRGSRTAISGLFL
jgi:hypothetical protein